MHPYSNLSQTTLESYKENQRLYEQQQIQTHQVVSFLQNNQDIQTQYEVRYEPLKFDNQGLPIISRGTIKPNSALEVLTQRVNTLLDTLSGTNEKPRCFESEGFVFIKDKQGLHTIQGPNGYTELGKSEKKIMIFVLCLAIIVCLVIVLAVTLPSLSTAVKPSLPNGGSQATSALPTST